MIICDKELSAWKNPDGKLYVNYKPDKRYYAHLIVGDREFIASHVHVKMDIDVREDTSVGSVIRQV